MNAALTISLSINCTLFAANRYQTYMLPLVSVTMPLHKWRKCSQELRTLFDKVGQSVSLGMCLFTIAVKSFTWGVGWA